MSPQTLNCFLIQNRLAAHQKILKFSLYGLSLLIKAEGGFAPCVGNFSALFAQMQASPFDARREEFKKLIKVAFQPRDQRPQSILSPHRQSAYAQEIESGNETAAWAHLILALRHWKGVELSEDHALARSYAEKVVAFGGEPKAWLEFGFGLMAFSERNFEDAQVHLRQVCAFGGEPGAWARLTLGEMFREKGDTASAKIQFTAIIGFGGEPSAWAHKNLADLALVDNQLAKAKEHFEHAIRFGGEPGAWGHLNLGDLALDEKDTHSAKMHFQAVFRVGGIPAAWACLSLGVYERAEKNREEAKKQFHQIFSFSTNSIPAGWGYKNLGDIALEENDLNAARSFYQQAVEVGGKPGQASSLILKGLAAGNVKSK